MTIYLDYAATTPVDPRVAAVMADCLGPGGEFANPSSTRHAPGAAAAARVAHSAEQVGALVGGDPAGIVWTSGATEANNLAILGAARFFRGRGRHIVTSRAEHASVLAPCRALEAQGWDITWLDSGADGLVDPDELAAALREDTVLVSLMLVNNETGVVQDLGAAAEACRRAGVLLHTDAAQAAGRVPLDAAAMGVDLVTLSAHKAYGPKGIGVLWMDPASVPRVAPLMHGGGQQRGLRPGTLPTHQVAGMGAAFELARAEAASAVPREAELCARLWRQIRELPGIRRNGHPQRRACHILNVSIAGVEGEALRFALGEFAVASGAACTSDSDEPSGVLRGLGLDDELARSSLRFSVGRWTTPAEVDAAGAALAEAVAHLAGLARGAA